MRRSGLTNALLLLPAVALLGGCLDTETVPCAWGLICPAGMVCDEVHEGCVRPEQLETCVGQADDTPCTVTGLSGQEHLCHEEICVSALVWKPVPIANQLSGRPEEFTGVWVFPGGELLVVGHDASMHHDGDTWRKDNSLEGDIWGVWASSPTDAFAVGADGTVAHYDGAGWQEMTVPVSSESSLLDVWGLSETQVYAVGEDGNLLIFDGSAWTARTHAYGPSLTGVWASRPDNLIIVGDGGIYGYDGRNIDLRVIDPGWWLWDVWGSSDTDIFAVGEQGLIVHYDGSTWSEMESPTDQALTGVWGSSSEDVFAVGNQGVILHFDGDAWSLLDSGTDIDLRSIHGIPGVGIYVAAYGSTLLRFVERDL